MSATAATPCKALRKLDGRIESVVIEIKRLYEEINNAMLPALKTSLPKALRIGELLYRVRESRRGKWLKWLQDNTPFLSQRTAYNYVRCYERRHELTLANIANLSEAYALLYPPKKRPSVEEEATAISNGDARGVLDSSQQESAAAPVPRALPYRPPVTRKAIWERELDAAPEIKNVQIQIDRQLREIIQQIGNQIEHNPPSAHWLDFPARLIAHGKALIQHGERLNGAKVT
jgi:hypothetical protein